jgi:ribose 5-phosphate isomerase B
MKVYLATDHTGVDLKNIIKAFLIEKMYEVEDCGAYEHDPYDDYPDFIKIAAQKVSNSPGDKAIIFGGSGQAEMMTANKFPHVRAALFYGPVVPHAPIDVNGDKSADPFEIVKLTRIHNNANILSLGVRFISEEDARHAVTLWLTTNFLHEERHQRRIEKIEEIEKRLSRG